MSILGARSVRLGSFIVQNTGAVFLPGTRKHETFVSLSSYVVSKNSVIHPEFEKIHLVGLWLQKRGFTIMVPISTRKVGLHFPFREKSGNFEHAGKVREFYPKYWKREEF